MNIQSAKNLLFDYFKNHDTFNLNDDFNKIVIVTETPEMDKGIVLLALKEYQSQGLLSSLYSKETSCWAFVLNRPLEQYSQTVQLNYNTIKELTNFINEYCGEDDKDSLVDSFNITEKDIQTLIVIAYELLNDRK